MTSDQDKTTSGRLSSNEKKTIQDHTFYVHITKQASDYDTTYKPIINHSKYIFDKGNNVTETLGTLIEYYANKWKSTWRGSIQAELTEKN